MKTKDKKTQRKGFFEKLKIQVLFIAALFMSVFFCIESISNGDLNSFDWIGISVSAVIIIWWLISIGIFINRRKTAKENKELEELKKNMAQQSDPDVFTSDQT